MKIKMSFKRENLEPLSENQMQAYADFAQEKLEEEFPKAEINIDLNTDSAIFEVESDIPKIDPNAEGQYDELAEKIEKIIDFDKWEKSGACPLPECHTFDEFEDLFREQEKTIPQWYGFDDKSQSEQEEIKNDLREWFSYSANYAIWYEVGANIDIDFYEGNTDINRFPVKF